MDLGKYKKKVIIDFGLAAFLFILAIIQTFMHIDVMTGPYNMAVGFAVAVLFINGMEWWRIGCSN
jgi:hypothetical protein